MVAISGYVKRIPEPRAVHNGRHGGALLVLPISGDGGRGSKGRSGSTFPTQALTCSSSNGTISALCFGNSSSPHLWSNSKTRWMKGEDCHTSARSAAHQPLHPLPRKTSRHTSFNHCNSLETQQSNDACCSRPRQKRQRPMPLMQAYEPQIAMFDLAIRQCSSVEEGPRRVVEYHAQLAVVIIPLPLG